MKSPSTAASGTSIFNCMGGRGEVGRFLTVITQPRRRWLQVRLEACGFGLGGGFPKVGPSFQVTAGATSLQSKEIGKGAAFS